MITTSLNRFVRFQLNSVASTMADFAVTIVLTEFAGFWYLISTSAGSLTGGIANFIVARHWVFRVSELPAFRQIRRYIINWCCSILLNITSVFVLTSLMHVNYLLSKVITAILVGVLFNYSFQRRYVFSVSQQNVTLTKTIK